MGCNITAGEASQSERTPTDPAKSGASATGASGSDSSTSSGAADGGGGGDDCTKEVEPNDIASAATPFTKSFCGKVNGDGNLDYGTYHLLVRLAAGPSGKPTHRADLAFD